MNRSYCRACRADLNGATLHIGRLPACNRFQTSNETVPDLADLTVCMCDECGLIQLVEAAPVEFVIPRVSWIRYTEPEAHLAEVTSVIEQFLPSGSGTICGMAPFARPLLTQFARLNRDVKEVDVRDYASTLTSDNSYPYLETIQSLMKLETFKSISNDVGLCDLVLCRYLLEHSNQPLEMLNAMRSCLSDNGLILIEVPDCKKFIQRSDYSFLWEEHILYFTEDSLRHLIAMSGFELLAINRYEGELEDALVAIIKPQHDAIKRELTIKSTSYQDIKPSFERYIQFFPSQQRYYQSLFKSELSKGKKIAIFGAGHQAIMFINAMQVHDSVSYVIDDDENKQGCYIPGTSIPIVSSDVFYSDPAIASCYLAVNSKIAEKICTKHAEYIRRGGRFISLFSYATNERSVETA